jgi:hypothetical protein
MELINLFIEDGDESGVSGVALVDSPAIEEGFFAFNKKRNLKKYQIQLGSQKTASFKPITGDLQVLAGALMIPDIEIYRNETLKDGTTKEYNVQFTKETINQIVQKFSASNFNNSVNHMHDATKPVNAVLFQHFIINRELGVMPPLNQDHLPDGTWFGFIKIKDLNVWNEFIKTGIYTGYSVEGLFYEEPVISEKEAEFIKSIVNTL